VRYAFFGKMGSGKTTAAQYLVEEHGFKRVSFASPLKKIGELKDILVPDMYYDWLYKWAMDLLPDRVYGMHFTGWMEGKSTREWLVDRWIEDFQESKDTRELLQRIGTDSGRKANPEIWINYFARHLPDGNLVVDDLRFLNEAQALRDLSFKLIKLEQPEEDRVVRLATRDGFFDPATQGHASETELSNIEADAAIFNDRYLDLDQFHAVLDELVRTRHVHVGA
jgi:dephospho-CoA kinase